jgi:MoaA/NifB/PqqE/SkfB family radical SAM enzyme
MKDFERLLNYYAAGRLFLPRPRYLCFNATLRCDGHCGHCGIWKDKAEGPELGAGRIGEVLKSPLFERVETAWLTGGEPTLREDVGDISRAMTGSLPSLKTLGIATNALDPGRTLDRVAAMKEAASPGGQNLFVHISLDGVGEVHDRVRGKAGAFAAVLETIDGLIGIREGEPGSRLEIGLNCVIQPINVAGLDGLLAFAKERGLPLMFNVVLVTDQVYRNKDMEKALSFSEDDRSKVVNFLDRIIPESPAPFQYQYDIIRRVLAGGPRPRRCLTLYTTVNINADGSLIPCPAASDIFPRSVVEEAVDKLWTSSGARTMRDTIRREYCPTCMLSCSLGDSMPLGEWLKGGWG